MADDVTMIERVARAISKNCCDGCECDGFIEPCVGRCACRASARAAIEAMREPTEAMLDASNREWDGRMSHRSSGAWQAMIDAALTPPPHEGDVK